MRVGEPFKLPKDKYEVWKNIDLNFYLNDISLTHPRPSR
jgi:hypothetical protein